MDHSERPPIRVEQDGGLVDETRSHIQFKEQKIFHAPLYEQRLFV